MGLVGQTVARAERTVRYQPMHGVSVRRTSPGLDGARTLPSMPEPITTHLTACCLMGFWGVPNFGDEWLFRATQAFLREQFPNIRLTGLVGSAPMERSLGQHQDDVALLDGFFPEPSFFAALPGIVRAIRSAELTLIGGGGLINDTYTRFSIPRYAMPALLSIALGTPVVWWGLGVVPPRRRLLRSLALWTLRHASLVLTRDPDSRAYLQANGVAALPGEDLSVLGPTSRTELAPLRTDECLLVVNFRDAIPSLAAGRLAFLETQAERFDKIILVAAEPCDEPIYREMVDILTQRQPSVVVEVLPATSYTRIQQVVAAASQVVSERLHISLFALGAGVATTVLSYERKIDEVVGRLYPFVGITPRARFWSSPPTTFVGNTGTLDIDVPACKRQIAVQLRLASQRRPEGFARMMAALWLCLLLPMGGALAAAIWLKRFTINLNSMRVVRQQRPGSGAFGIGWAAVGRFSRSLRL